MCWKQAALCWLLLAVGAQSTSLIQPYPTTARDPDEVGAQPRIINGDAAPSGRYTWIARYVYNGFTESCGGSLIAPDIVLTNAHCWTAGAADLGTVYIGTILREERDPAYTVSEQTFHPDYERVEGAYIPYNDLAILKIEGTGGVLQPIQLNFDADFPSETGTELKILGWGSTTTPPPLTPSDELKMATTQYISFNDCAVASDPVTGNKFGNSPENTSVGPDWLCTNDPVGATCNGDSGGPVIREGVNPRTDLLVGVISGASGGCTNQYLPQINQRVSYHRDWIVSTVCAFSDYPPADFGCPGTDPTSPPVAAPTSPPTIAPVAPTGVPSAAPVSETTTTPPSSAAPIPTTETTIEPSSPTVAPSMSPKPSKSNMPSFVPTLTPSPVEGVPIPDDGRGDETTARPVGAIIGTFSPYPTSSPAPTSSKVTVYIKIIFDDKPQHTGWFIADINYARFRVAVPIGAYTRDDEVANDQVSVEGGQSYMFVISDLKGDGFANGGSYEVFLGEEFGYEVLASGSGDFGLNETTTFFVPCAIGITCPPTEAGTRAPNAPPISTMSPTAAVASAEPTITPPPTNPAPTRPTLAPSPPTRSPTRTPTLRPTPQSAAADTHIFGFFFLVVAALPVILL